MVADSVQNKDRGAVHLGILMRLIDLGFSQKLLARFLQGL